MVTRILEGMEKSRTGDEFIEQTLIPRLKNPITFSSPPYKHKKEENKPIGTIRFVLSGKPSNTIYFGLKKTHRRAGENSKRFSFPYMLIDGNKLQIPLSQSSWPKNNENIKIIKHKNSASESHYLNIPQSIIQNWPKTTIKEKNGSLVAEVKISEENYNEIKKYSSLGHLIKGYTEALSYLEHGIDEKLISNAGLKRHTGNVQNRLRSLFNGNEKIINGIDIARNDEEVMRELQKTKLPRGFLHLMKNKIIAAKNKSNRKISELNLFN